MSTLARALIETWFGGSHSDQLDMNGPIVRRWFTRNDAFDAELRERFGPALDQAARGSLGAWCVTPHGSLAFVILCDQISRNIHRGSARAFATDNLAVHESLASLARGSDKDLSIPERVFLLMPLMHSEDLAVHDIARREFTRVRDEAPSGMRGYADGTLGYEEKHRVIIERFGRYPHRNTALGRTSTPDEVTFCADPKNGF